MPATLVETEFIDNSAVCPTMTTTAYKDSVGVGLKEATCCLNADFDTYIPREVIGDITSSENWSDMCALIRNTNNGNSQNYYVDGATLNIYSGTIVTIDDYVRFHAINGGYIYLDTGARVIVGEGGELIPGSGGQIVDNGADISFLGPGACIGVAGGTYTVSDGVTRRFNQESILASFSPGTIQLGNNVTIIIDSDSKLLWNANSTWQFGTNATLEIYGTVEVADNVVLSFPSTSNVSIHPGATFLMGNNSKIEIYGLLNAQGTAENPITFTRSGSSGYWDGIWFEDSADDGSIIKNAVIEYATYGIYCNRANPMIQNSSISHCNYGIYLYYSSPANIETNSITNNFTGIKGISSSPNITDNLFRDNSSSGVSFSGGAPIFYDNTFDGNSFGAYFVSGSSPKFGPTGTAGKGNNVITENSYGIYAQYYSQPFLGSHGYYPGDRIGGYNSICDNSVSDATAYFYTDIEAEYNWWGSSPVRLASYGSSINYSYALGSDPGGGSSLGKLVVITEDNSGWENEDRWAGFDPNNPDINSLSDLWLWGHYLYINDKLEDAIGVYQMLVSKFSDDNYANRALVKIYHLYRDTGKDGLAEYLNVLLSNSKIDGNIHRILYLLLLNTSLNNKDINSSLNTIETIMYRFSDTYVEKTALYYLVLACLNDLNDIEEASRYMVLLKEKYPDDELTYMAREAMGEKVSWSLNKPVIEPETADVSFPDRYALHNNYPNPFNPVTTITFDLLEESHVILTVYDILGREVRTLVNYPQTAGYKSVVWDGKDGFGNSVASGVYIYSIVAGDFTAVKKLLLIR